MRKFLVIYLVVILVVGVNATEQADTLELKELEVSAIKSTNQKITNSKTSLSRRDIERLGVNDAKGMSAIAPNFYIADYGSRITSSIYVRGIGARIDQPVVGMNIDNTPILNKDNYDLSLLDIESIEILRGPQSTLYGRNTMGGLINIRTLSPLTYQGCRALVEYGSENNIKVGAGYYGKTSDKFGIGANVFYQHSDGYFTNTYNGEKCDKENFARASVKLEWKPNESVMIENAASTSLVRQGGYAYEFLETGSIGYNDTCYYKRTNFLDGLTVKWKGDKISLSSITSYQYLNDNMTLDQDFLPQAYFTLTQTKKEHGITQDFVVKSETAGKVRWLAGAFGFFKHTKMNAPVTFKEYGIEQLITKNWNAMSPNYPIIWDSESFLLGSDFTMPNYGVAAYGEVSVDWNRFTFTGGLRFDYEHTHLKYASDCDTRYTIYKKVGDNLTPYSPREIAIHNKGKLDSDFNELLPKFSINYTLPTAGKSSIYATISKGYKAGGFNTQMFSDVLQQELMAEMGLTKSYEVEDVISYDPEKSWNYELGGSWTSTNGRYKVDANVYYIDCRDQQVTIFPSGLTTGRIMANAGKTRSFGGEVSVSASPINGLILQGGYGYTNAKFKEFNNGKENFAGKYVPYAPTNTVFANAAYSLKVSDNFLRYITFNIDTTGAGRIYWNESNTTYQDIYFLLNAGVKFSGENYSLNLWAQNITDTDYATFYFVSIQHEFLQRGKPARFGATLRFNF